MELQNGYFSLNGKPFFLYSGEVHYFRIPRGKWAARLKSLKAAGFNAVSTYIPWLWHEPEEGHTDFEGRTAPERDLLGFLDLAKKEGLAVCARVGPVSNAELTHEGLPGWLIQDHPEIFFRGARDVGNLPHVTMVSYLHPVFLDTVSRWYGALLPHIVPRQVTHGGNVISVQLCNEVGMVHWLQKGAEDREPTNALFREFLKETYGSVNDLNTAHRSTYATFEEVRQPAGHGVDPTRLTVHMDWSLFYRRYYAGYFQKLSTWARQAGVDVPIFCNIPQFYDYDIRGRANWAPMTTSLFRDFPLLTPEVVFGGAYQMRHLDFENFHDVALTTEVTRMLGAVHVDDRADAALVGPERLPSLPPFEALSQSPLPVVCAELQTGIMRDRPRLYPPQVELNLKSSVGQGLSGVNAYMFAGGENVTGLGAFGAYHDWQAPIGLDGEKRAHLEPLKDFGRFLKWAGPSLAMTRKSVDTALGFYLPYYATEYWSGPWVEALESQRTNLWFDGMARLIQLAGYSVCTTDLQRSPVDVLLSHPSLWVFSLDFMDHETQAKLAGYVKNGGKLFLGPCLPTVDLRGETDRTLADALGLSITGGQPGNVFHWEGKDWWVQGPIQTYSAENEIRRWMEVPSGAAVLQASAGRGEVLAMGFGLPHVFDHFRHWVRQWAEAMGVFPKVECAPWDVLASLRESDDLGFLFLFNYHFTQRSVTVRFPRPGTRETLRLPGAGTLTLPPLSAVVLPLNVPVGPQGVLAHSTAEVLDLSCRARDLRLVLRTVPGTRAEVCLQLRRKPRRVMGGAKTPAVRWSKGRATVTVTADRPETPLRLIF